MEELSNMDAITIGLITFFVVGVIVAIVAMVWVFAGNRRTKQLREQFGPEYRRTLRAEGNAAHGEQILQERAKRVHKLVIKPLTKQQRDEFADAWEQVQAQFVDDPIAALAKADILVKEVMTVRGYPVVDFEQRVADVSVDHPAVAQNYRIAHAIAERDETEDVPMEKLREGMLHYRALFADLLHDGGLSPVRDVRGHERIRHAA
jgi:hypothetical protein